MRQMNRWLLKVNFIIFCILSFIRSDCSLVLSCFRNVEKRNFYISFINEVFLIKIINSNIKKSQPVYKHKSHIWYNRLIYLGLYIAAGIYFNYVQLIGQLNFQIAYMQVSNNILKLFHNTWLCHIWIEICLSEGTVSQ